MRDYAIPVALACVASAGLAIGLSFPLLSLTLDDWGVSPTGVGLFALGSAFATIAITPFVPGILSRMGSKRALILGLIAVSGLFFLYRTFPDIKAWFAFRALASFAFCIVFVACEGWALERTEPARRGFVMGVFASTFAGAMALGGAFVALFGHRALETYLLGAAIPMAGLLAVLLLPATPLTPPKGEAAKPRALFARMKAAPLIMLAPLAMGAIETAKYNLTPIYARRVELSDDVAAALITASGLGVLLLQPLVGWVADRIGPVRGLMACALAGLTLPLAIAAIGANPLGAMGLMFLYSGLVTGLYTIGLVLLARRFTGEDLPGANAAYALTYGIGQIAGPAVAGPAFGAFGPWGFMAALSALSALYLAAILSRARQMA
jgi:MFS family permease